MIGIHLAYKPTLLIKQVSKIKTESYTRMMSWLQLDQHYKVRLLSDKLAIESRIVVIVLFILRCDKQICLFFLVKSLHRLR